MVEIIQRMILYGQFVLYIMSVLDRYINKYDHLVWCLACNVKNIYEELRENEFSFPEEWSRTIAAYRTERKN